MKWKRMKASKNQSHRFSGNNIPQKRHHKKRHHKKRHHKKRHHKKRHHKKRHHKKHICLDDCCIA
ncbi:hypothetical protein HY793_02575 [Candidatus Desantisbacteria bacterium]|nr:hypothetical protein [Candidatus Desantisbacteria bacterium]